MSSYRASSPIDARYGMDCEDSATNQWAWNSATVRTAWPDARAVFSPSLPLLLKGPTHRLRHRRQGGTTKFGGVITRDAVGEWIQSLAKSRGGFAGNS